MIQPQTLIKVADNTGAKTIRVFKVLGGSKRRYARIGDRVIGSVTSSEPRKEIKKKDIVTAVIVRQKKPVRRLDGSYISFSENAGVIIDGKKREVIGTRVFGPVPRELEGSGYKKITSLAPEVV